jgi:hypothetical protein
MIMGFRTTDPAFHAGGPRERNALRNKGPTRMRRLIDISIPLENDVPAYPPIQKVSITYTDHKQSAPLVASLFLGLKPDDLPAGEGWAVEQVNISTHNGTHLDAPYDFASTMNRGERAITAREGRSPRKRRPAIGPAAVGLKAAAARIQRGG